MWFVELQWIGVQRNFLQVSGEVFRGSMWRVAAGKGKIRAMQIL
jgi:hypothetical protein